MMQEKGKNSSSTIHHRKPSSNDGAELSRIKDLFTALSFLFDELPDAVYFKDADSRFIYINRAKAEHMGLTSPEEAIGKTDFDFYNEDFARQAYMDERNVVKAGKPILKIEKVVYRDGRVRWVKAVKIPVKNRRGRIIGLAGISTDITKLKIMKDALYESEERFHIMVKYGQMKDRFISVATHELRTPLVSIKGYLDLILSGKAGEVPPRILQFLKVVERNVERLRRLTDDLLDVQRIESGKLKLSREPLDMRGVVEEVVREMLPFVEQKKHRLRVKIPDRPLPVYGDRIRLAQALTNLLSNSVKFTPEGGEIRVEAEDRGDEIAVRVSDTGFGIAKEDLPKLFKPFPDIKKPIVTEKSTGLGLVICKGIIKLHGGRIWAESPGLGKGSTFTFTIPKYKGGGRAGR